MNQSIVVLFVMLLNVLFIKGQVLNGNSRMCEYLPLLNGKKVGVLVNHSSTINGTHLVDTLLTRGITVTTIFAPEHGFRGNADAGEKINSSKDNRTGLPIVSLYGDLKKPTKEQLSGIDWVIFDIQDVGVRFYTYISSMHYLMEACAENGVSVLILDRPNPNGDYVDGPVLDLKFKSFVGMHPIPVVHGLTIGELAKMINNEGWLKGGVKCNLRVVTMVNYTHQTMVSPEVSPSPNLPNLLSIRLYPSLCFFEGTDISIGRGTHFPFQVIGYPDKRFGSYEFKPVSINGMAKTPLHENKICYGVDLRNEDVSNSVFTLKYLLDFKMKWNKSGDFITRPSFFNLLAGNDVLIKQINSGLREDDIRATWQPELEKYKALRKKYLLYP